MDCIILEEDLIVSSSSDDEETVPLPTNAQELPVVEQGLSPKEQDELSDNGQIEPAGQEETLVTDKPDIKTVWSILEEDLIVSSSSDDEDTVKEQQELSVNEQILSADQEEMLDTNSPTDQEILDTNERDSSKEQDELSDYGQIEPVDQEETLDTDDEPVQAKRPQRKGRKRAPPKRKPAAKKVAPKKPPAKPKAPPKPRAPRAPRVRKPTDQEMLDTNEPFSSKQQDELSDNGQIVPADQEETLVTDEPNTKRSILEEDLMISSSSDDEETVPIPTNALELPVVKQGLSSKEQQELSVNEQIVPVDQEETLDTDESTDQEMLDTNESDSSEEQDELSDNGQIEPADQEETLVTDDESVQAKRPQRGGRRAPPKRKPAAKKPSPKPRAPRAPRAPPKPRAPRAPKVIKPTARQIKLQDQKMADDIRDYSNELDRLLSEYNFPLTTLYEICVMNEQLQKMMENARQQARLKPEVKYPADKKANDTFAKNLTRRIKNTSKRLQENLEMYPMSEDAQKEMNTIDRRLKKMLEEIKYLY